MPIGDSIFHCVCYAYYHYVLWLGTIAASHLFFFSQAVGPEILLNIFSNSIGFPHLKVRYWLCHKDIRTAKEQTEYQYFSFCSRV